MNYHDQYAHPSYLYGAHGYRKGHPANPKKCRWEICTYIGGWPHHHQCTRTASIDGLWCKVHSPEATEERRKKSDEKSQAQWHKHHVEMHAQTLLKHLKIIAEGKLNDPASYAELALKELGL